MSYVNMIRAICNEAPTIDNGGNPAGGCTSSTSARTSSSNATNTKGPAVPRSAGESRSAARSHDAAEGASKRVRDAPLNDVARGGIVPKIEVEINPTLLSLTGGAAGNPPATSAGVHPLAPLASAEQHEDGDAAAAHGIDASSTELEDNGADGDADADASSTELENNGADGDADSAADDWSIADATDKADSDWLPDVENSDSDEASIADTRDEDADDADTNMPAVVPASGPVVPQMARYVIICTSCYYWYTLSNITRSTRIRSTHVAWSSAPPTS
ncbi:unnamed protein product [Ectocarpus sp. 8 AP-2014]